MVSAQIELEQDSVSAMAPVLNKLARLLAKSRHASLRRAFAEWTRHLVERSRTAAASAGLVSALKALEETGDLGAMGSLLAERIDEYVEARVKEGIEARIKGTVAVPESLAKGAGIALEVIFGPCVYPHRNAPA